MRIRMITGLVCAAAVLLGYSVHSGATQAEFKMIKELDQQERGAGAELMIKRPSCQYTSASERDPFEGLITRDEEQGMVKISDSVEIPPPAMTVQGIIWGGQFPLAIVDNKLVKEGDTIGSEVEIIQIEPFGVVFKFHDKEYTLSAPAVQTGTE